ncbi:hypothetical protein [Pseudomonas citronellolis]|uniref:hypothetical protein n=1 Tax=Pseudomonas citronellolis TaxID=53408 RepID=UPI0023E3BD56|nr:hypothetical protein [Pseudomonas citronellolis]MDF3935515.1 hypothetical protein [Pseudomonas citronellolis]
MNPKDWIELLQRLFGWISDRRNPARRQAARVLATFEAHGVACTEINALLPASLQLTAYQWSNPDQLKLVLQQAHLDWINQHFALEPCWLSGTSNAAHQKIFSYKAPTELHQWFMQHGHVAEGIEFRLYLITPDTHEIGPDTEGYYALILEQLGDDLSACSRFFHLTEGGHFEHYPSLIHLLQVLAIAHYHGAIFQRSQLEASALYQLSHHQGLIPSWLDRCRPHPLEADHELWPHFSGHSPWLDALRAEAEEGLLLAGSTEVLERLHDDTQRFSRQPSSGPLPTALAR